MPETVAQKIQIDGVAIDIFKELILWGEALWWPKSCPMKIVNTTKGPIGVGTCYRYRVDMPFGLNWEGVNRIIDKKNLYLRRDFFKGSLEGFEEATITPDESGYCEVAYTFAVDVKGKINMFFWKKIGKPLHVKNIDIILHNLKNHIERKR